MPAAYSFVDRWFVRAPIDRVYQTIGDVAGYEHWWTDFVRETTGAPGEPVPGRKNGLVVKAYLPYKVRFALEVLEAEKPRRIILSRISGTSTERASGG